MSSGMNGTKSRGGFVSFAELSGADLRSGVTVWVHGGSRYDIYDSDPGGATQIANGKWAKEVSDTAASVNWGSINGVISNQSDLQLALDAKVDEVPGKQLSDENYTSAEKIKVSGVGDGAQVVSVVAGSNVTVDNTDPQNPIVSSTGGGSTDWGGIGGTLSNQTDLQDALDDKVDAVAGKQLSEEDYTTVEKTKLSGVGDGAQVVSVVAGANVTVDNTDPQNPIVSASGTIGTSWGSIGGTLSDQTDLQNALDGKVNTVAGKQLSDENYTLAEKNKLSGVGDGAQVVSVVAGSNITIDNTDPQNPIVSSSGGGSGGKQLTNKTSDPTGNLPAWAAWIADSSGGALTRPMNPTPSDGEEATAIDISENAQTNNITLTVVPPTTINGSVIDKNGQSKKWRYDSANDVWDLVFSGAPASGTGPAYQVETKILYISDGLISEIDTGAELSANRREVVDIESDLGLGWSSEKLWIQTEIFNDTGNGAAGWSNPEFINSGGGVGVKSCRKTNEIIVQSGSASPFPGPSSFSGNAFGLTLASQPTVKTRILVTRLTYAGGLDLVDSAILDAGTVAINSRYTFDIATQLGASWVGADILTVCQVQIGGEWGEAGWVYIADAHGVEAGMLNTDTIAVQTGRGSLITANGNESGHPFGAITAPTTAPCRILCYKFTDDAIADGIVASETYSLGNLADNTRTVTALSTINPDFVGKHLAVLAEVQQPTNLWGAGGWWTTSNIALGCRANQQYDAIVTQSGNDSITSISNLDGSPHGTPNYTANRFIAPTRLKLWRFG